MFECLIPRQGTARLVFNDAGLEEIAFFLQVNHFTHPWERIFFVGEESFQANLSGAAVGDVAQVAFEHGSVEAEYAAGHGVFGITVFEFNGFQEQLIDFGFEFSGPQLGVLEFDLVDQVDAEVAVHGFVAQDVLVLLGSASHLILTTQGQNLGKAHVKEQAFHEASEHDERLQKRLICFLSARFEVRVHDGVNERNQELVFVADGLNFVVRVEDFAFVQAQRLSDVLVGVGVNGFFKGLAQQELAALRRSDVTVSAQSDVVGGQGIGGDEETQVALDQSALVFCQTVGVFPERNVACHVDFLRHPVVGASGEIFLPGPFVFEGHQLVDVGLAIDDALVGCIYAASGTGGRSLRASWRHDR